MTYVLVQNGLNQKDADWRPVDKKITVAEWLSYAAIAVPNFASDLANGTDSKAAVDSPTNTTLQVPIRL